jgi:hypothetical protein
MYGNVETSITSEETVDIDVRKGLPEKKPTGIPETRNG